ncbi:argonaute/piwi family protein [Candidatus Nitrososphaera gargensis]|uniref:hypothetical protein n=1 Tax=Candidatus Nitrososphaera gargensis TaxID=497727 RepID=UPI0011E5775C|nr:hypothetical protein [Candidatus Nitrososphaera gargensis]
MEGDAVDHEPNLLFDKFDSSAIHHQVYWGLRKFGPYEKSKSRIKLAIIAPKDKLIQTKSIVSDLQSGSISILPGGMKSFFRCELELVDERVIDKPTGDAYSKIANEFVAASNPSNLDLVLVNIPKTGQYILDSPYYKVKGTLASAGFVTQMVTEATFANLKWSYLNLASGIFSKAGAIPWVLHSPMQNTDMILGISKSNILPPDEGPSQMKRYVGHVNVFDNNGKWMTFESNAEPYNPKEKKEISTKLGELVGRAAAKFRAMKKYEPKKIVLHNSKRFGKEDREAIIASLRANLSDFNVAFVTIDESHPFRLYDMSTDDGSFPRGYFAYLDRNDALLSTTGQSAAGGRRIGTPKILHISLYQPLSEFITMEEVVNQVVGLTKLDWATSMAFVREPVTIHFANEVAYLTAALTYSQWRSINGPAINSILNQRPWFL